jgi:tyrosine-protein phosphatase YwqE
LGLFNLFKKNKTLEKPVDLSVLVTDIHSHFIPGIDDGAKTLSDSIELINELHQLGYKKIITTPHTMSDFYKNTSTTILDGLKEVKKELKEKNIPIHLEAASEYYLDYDFERKIEEEELLTFGNKYVLFEVSYLNPPDNIYHIIFKMQTKGYQPVLAHPERYNFWHNQFSKYQEFVEKGVLLQLNINSLTGYYSDDTKKIAELLIENNMISLLGTDCHHMGHINLIKQAVYKKHLLQLIESGKLLNASL